MTTSGSCSNEDNKKETICYSELAREGLSLMLNNKQEEAENLFKKYPESIQMNAGYAYAVFTDALMTFEDEKLHVALEALKDLEKKCSVGTSWMRSMRTKMFGSDSVPLTYVEQLESQIILADSHVFVATLTFLQQDISGYFKGGWMLRKSYKLYQHTYSEILSLYKEIVGDINIPNYSNHQVILSCDNTPDVSDTTVIEATPDVEALEMTQVTNSTQPNNPSAASLTVQPVTSPRSKNGYRTTFPKHSISCYENLCTFCPRSSSADRFLKNGLAKGESKYARNAASQLDTPLKKSISFNDAFQSNERRFSFAATNISLSYFTSSFNIFSSKLSTKDIDKESISRLLCAASFGYGLLQLGISLLPPSLLRLTNFLGFGGNRKTGLENLMFARHGTDMRAPFATLALLWYHTIVRPFFALDGNNVEAGVEAAAQLIEETKEEYGQSALFLFFKGRVERLNSDIPSAITAFQAAIDNAAQKEIKMMSLHEVGWCHLIQLDFAKSKDTFSRLRQSSRWSRPFYSYLTLISAGSDYMFQNESDTCELRNVFQPVPKGTQLDEFLNRRYKICPLDEDVLRGTSYLFWRLLVYELLYLWNTLPSCSNDNIRAVVEDCEQATEANCEPMVGLAKLIEGSCLCILRRSNEGVDSFRDCLEKRKNLPYNCSTAHVSAFAQYELGLLLIRNEQTLSEGKRLLQLAAYNYKDYDFEQRLSVRVVAILKNFDSK